MKRIKRTLVILVALGMIFSLTMVIPASAKTSSGDVKVTDSEFVFATINPLGDITGVQVFDWLSLKGDGSVEVKEEKSFSDIGGYQGVHSFTTPKVEGNYIVWPELSVSGNSNVVANTTLSEPMVEEAKMRIPLDIRFKYWFDGAPITDPAEVTGKSGRFKMEVTFKNTSKESTMLEYKDPATGEMVLGDADTYLPIVIQPYDWYFDNTIFFDLEADPTGLVINMPDFYNVGWSIPLFPPATGESDTIWISADVKNFQLPPLTIAAAFVFPETNQADPFELLGPGLEQIYDGVVQLSEGFGSPTTDPSLLFGITAVNDGLMQMAAGLPTAVSNIDSAMIPGVNQMVAGIGSATTPDTLLYAQNAVSMGLQSINYGIGSETSDNTLLYAANAVSGGLNAITASIGTAATSDTLLYALDKVKEGLEATAAAIGTPTTAGTLLFAANALIGGLAQIYTATAPPGPITSLQTAAAGIQQQFTVDNFPTPPPNATMLAYVNNNAAYGGAMNAQDIAVIGGIMSGLNTNAVVPLLIGLQGIHDAVGDGTPGVTLAYAANAIYGGLDLISQGIGSATQADTLLYAITAMTGGLLAIQQGIGSATSPDTLLYAVAAIEMGLKGIKSGIGDSAINDTLLYAMSAIQGGLAGIKGGLSTGNMSDPGIKEGLVLISSGLSEAIAGLGSPSTPDTLLYGSDALLTGLTDAGDGATQLEDGMGMLLGMLNLSTAQLEAIKIRGEEFDSFLGRAEDATNNVRFVYQMNPTYNYKSGSTTSWIVAIVLSIIIALALAAGGIALARMRSSA
jgi:hypothetical protein